MIRLNLISVLLIIVCWPAISWSQVLTLVKEVQIAEPVGATLDRNGTVYVADARGNLNKFSQNGDFELNFASSKNKAPTLVEAWTTLDVLIFFEATQSITILNRFLTPKSEYSLEGRSGFARLATFNFESNLWIVDDSDFSLKMLDLSFDRITVSTALNQILDPDEYEFSFIREYQNLVFVSDVRSGILIFDNLGNYLKKIPVKGIYHFGFLQNEIYFQSTEGLIFTDIYSGKKRFLEAPQGKYVLVTDDRVYLINKRKLSVYSYND